MQVPQIATEMGQIAVLTAVPVPDHNAHKSAQLASMQPHMQDSAVAGWVQP